MDTCNLVVLRVQKISDVMHILSIVELHLSELIGMGSHLDFFFFFGEKAALAV
jgi:hypothetical protein